MPIQGIRYNINSGTEQHRSYQSTGSFVAYNPNDGIAFIALDRTATQLDYDHRLPSQSGGKFPGPINSYLSIYYQDQSGGGTPGSLMVYATTEDLQIPYFWSIGRALTTFSTTLDIVQGSQPGNPGTGVTRLWTDGTGHLHLLQGSGADYTVLDSNNYATYIQLTVGDVVGPLNNTLIQMRNGSVASARDSGGTLRNLIQLDGSNYVNFWNAGGFHWRILNQSGSAALFEVDNSGNTNVGGSLTVAGALYCDWLYPTYGLTARTGGSIYLRAGNGLDIRLDNNNNLYMNNGYYIYWGDTNHKIFDTSNTFYFDEYNGGWVWRDSSTGFAVRMNLQGNGQLNVYNDLVMQNTNMIAFEGSKQVYIQYRGDYGALYAPYWLGIFSPYFHAISGFVAQNGNTANRLEGGYVISAYAAALGTAWSIRSERRLKDNLVVLPDAECLARISNPKNQVYKFTFIDDDLKRERMGFMADEMIEVAPEFAWANEEGEANAVEYSTITSLLWGAMRSLLARVERLESAA